MQKFTAGIATALIAGLVSLSAHANEVFVEELTIQSCSKDGHLVHMTGQVYADEQDVNNGGGPERFSAQLAEKNYKQSLSVFWGSVFKSFDDAESNERNVDYMEGLTHAYNQQPKAFKDETGLSVYFEPTHTESSDAPSPHCL